MAIDLNKLLVDIKNPDEDMVVLALRTLKRVKSPSFANNVEISLKIIKELERLVEGCSDEVRFFAQECLDYVEESVPKNARAASAPATESSPEPAVPKGSKGPKKASAIAGLESKEKVLAFLSKGVRDPKKASISIAALRGKLNPKELPLIKKYLRHKSPLVRVESARTIASVGDEKVILETLLPYLNDQAPAVRESVLAAFKSIEKQRLLTVIESMLRAKQINVKVAAVFILAHLQGEDVLRLLGLAARDEQEEVRYKVVEALQGRRGKDVLVILKGLVNDLDIDVAEKALKIYEKLKFEEGILNSSAELGDSIMDKLKEISLEDDDGGDSEDEGGEEELSLELPTDPSKRVSIDEGELNEFVVPKKEKRRRPSPGPEALSSSEEALEETTEEASDAEEGFKRLNEYPEEIQKMSEEVYDELDETLEEMGRTIWRLEKSNRISDRRFSKLNYDIQRYEDMLSKRKNEKESKEGFFSKLSPGNRRLQEKQQLNLEFSLSELYRRLGEIAVELSLSEESRFPELESYYKKVDDLLENVRKIKEMHDL